MTNQRVIGVDLGGTKILAGLIEDGRVRETVAHPTPTTSQDALFDGLASAVRELPLDGVDAVGFGIPSRFDYAPAMRSAPSTSRCARSISSRR